MNLQAGRKQGDRSERVSPVAVSSDEVAALAANLVEWFDVDRSYVVALSGGVDSAVVAQAAGLSQSACVLVTSHSPSVAQRERKDAEQIALRTGLPFHVMETQEVAQEDYRKNDVRRCYFCKSHLFDSMAGRFPGHQILTGTNLDDLGDYRPGLQAADQAHVRAPLVELKVTKAQVRDLARYWQLPLAEKPASPCLASRVAYGIAVTEERLAMVERAETLLHKLGIAECRVRLHAQDLARIEVPEGAISVLAESGTRQRLISELKHLGFRYVTLDLEGFRSGNLNDVVQIQSIR